MLTVSCCSCNCWYCGILRDALAAHPQTTAFCLTTLQVMRPAVFCADSGAAADIHFPCMLCALRSGHGADAPQQVAAATLMNKICGEKGCQVRHGDESFMMNACTMPCAVLPSPGSPVCCTRDQFGGCARMLRDTRVDGSDGQAPALTAGHMHATVASIHARHFPPLPPAEGWIDAPLALEHGSLSPLRRSLTRQCHTDASATQYGRSKVPVVPCSRPSTAPAVPP